jgi:2-keto-4-pentenoate hydratase/2-oxohepta-3-ene-1,7-dioic acid hydratase in catechol pathway
MTEIVPSKIVAVHVSYRSRAMERGSLPPWPSYFLKPPNTVAASGDSVARPPGCELLAFEGDDLLFSFADIVADITRLTTLEPGDVILTGTAAVTNGR